MTEDEKISLLSGENVWFTRPIGEGDPLTMRDGPHGVRDGTPSFCYPNLNLAACSWDRALLYEMGECLGSDARAHGVNVLLAPGINLKRNPLCGRNFEYSSEDPYLTGELAAEYVKGIQSTGTAACVKHYCCNNREAGRFSYSVNVDERTLREMYIKPFEIVVKKAMPMCLMTAYNRINGEFAAQNGKLLDILRNELHYEGVVMSDWGGVDDRVKSYKNGLDLEMPGSDSKTHDEVKKAVQKGKLSMERIEQSVSRLLRLADFCARPVEGKPAGNAVKAAVKIAEESIVLLKNFKGLLPLSSSASVAVLGAAALKKTSQGEGCAMVETHAGKSAFAVLSEKFARCEFFQTPDASLEAFDAVVVFIETDADSEGYDRSDMSVNADLLKSCRSFNAHTVSVLVNGSAVDLREVNRFSSAILETFYAGQVFGEAVGRVLTGEANPSGRLAESFISSMIESPCFGEEKEDELFYREGVSVGYRYYRKKGIRPVYPFGFGLSYTRFVYKSFVLNVTEVTKDIKTLRTEIVIANEGGCDGKEVIQIYLHSDGRNGLPSVKLVAFDKVFLKKGETKKVVVEIETDNFKYYDMRKNTWSLPKGEFTLSVNADAERELQKKDLRIGFDAPVDRYTTVGELIARDGGAKIVKKYLRDAVVGCIIGDDATYPFEIENGHIKGEKFFCRVAEGLELRQMVSMSNNKLSNEELNKIIQKINEDR